MVNLVAELGDARFDERAHARALREIAAAGFGVETVGSPGDPFTAWLDERFGGTWSSEAYAGQNVIASRDGARAAFATFAPQGLRFAWLREMGARDGVGIFGPFGVTPEMRGTPGLGPNVLVAALASLRRMGYARALIPAVGEEKLVAYYQKHAAARVVERFPKARWSAAKVRTVVLASGHGTNLQMLLDRAAAGTLPLEIAAVVSNVSEAGALERARAAGIPAVDLPWTRSEFSREQYDRALRERVEALGPELIVLAGWMHLLDAAFVERFPDAINIHPAFLPLDQGRDNVGFPDGTQTSAYRGASAIRDALRDGVGWVGTTAHLLSLQYDRGRVLVRRPMRVAEGEPAAAVAERLRPLEHAVLAGGIMRWVYER